VNSRPFKSFISLSCAFVLTACASTAAGIVVVAELESPPLAQRNVWVANFRSEDGESAAFGEDRPDALRFERHVVAIPPRYETGQIELPSANPDTDSQFVTRSIERFASSGELMDDIDATYGERVPELGLFVHGYNTSHAAAVYGFAQLLHEYDAPFPAVLFSWPSSAQVRGYVYDRDSVAISRNRLERMIRDISRADQRLTLIGHSMGTYLIMETLRQMEIREPGSVHEKVDTVILLSPDIDPEVFRDQFAELSNPPSPFVVAISREDRALRVSGRLTGTQQRLGSLEDPDSLSDLPITVVDMTNLADGTALDHSTFATSSTAIELLRHLRRSSALLGQYEGASITLGP
jgi:esterase/lipase superfamily enzyme